MGCRLCSCVLTLPALLGWGMATGCGPTVVAPASATSGDRAVTFERAVERRVFADGSRYLVIEALDDDLLHFEMAASGAPAADLSRWRLYLFDTREMDASVRGLLNLIMGVFTR